MVSIANMNSSQAAKYHEKDQNYYQDAKESLELSSWQGRGAEALGLTGAVENEVFNRLCHGINPEEDKVLVDTTKRAGTDLTFSAPKSLSILSELSDKKTDLKLREAHAKAVEKTMQFVEQYAQTREQINGERKAIDTQNLVIAKFNHDTSREQDPQLHTHCFVLNMTQKENGEWRALHNDQLFKNKMLFGQIYRNELAKNIKDLGFDIEITNAKQGLWELKNFNQDLLKEFSTRREQVEKRFIELKAQFPHLSDAKLKEMATLDSRKVKDKNIDRKAIKEINIKRAEEILGQELNPFCSVTHLSQTQENLKTELKVDEVLKIVQEILTSKESLFTKEQLIQESLKLSINSYTLADIEEAIKQDKELVNLESNIYTTKEMIQTEKKIVENIQNAKELNPLTDKETAKEFINSNFSTFTQGQKEAFLHITTSQEQIIAVQGDAGSGKTYMLKALKEFSNKNNLQGLALTGKAAEEIEKESGIKSDTLHSFLNQKEFKDNQVYIVDEASMIGSKQLHQLQQIANKTNSKIVLIGDTKQFQTIQAGSIFSELQKRNLIKTAYMSENLRAKTDLLKEIYQDIKNKDIKKAFENIEYNNLIKETSNLQEIKEQYLKDSDNTLLIASKNKDRRELNQIIRDESKEHITNPKELTIRENTALDDVERHYSQNYRKDQIVFINKPIPGLKAGSEHIIKDVDTLSNTITLLKDNKEIQVNLSKHGNKLSSFNILNKEFGVNDKIVFTKNDKKLGIKNGQTATITKLAGDTLHYKKENGDEATLNLNNYNYIDWGYAITDYKAQGQTSKSVIVLADSQMANMNSFYVQVTRAKENLKIFTDDLETLKERAEQEQTKTSTLDYSSSTTNNQQIIKQEEIKEMAITQQQHYLDTNEFNLLKQKTKDELKLTDPSPVLDKLGIEYKQSSTRYIFKVREERTASANMYLDARGEWKYKDFGGKNGTIENLIMDVTNCSYKEALEFALKTLNVKDYVEERLQELKGNNYKKEEVKDLQIKKEENLQKVKEQNVTSKILSIKDIDNYKPALDYLRQRGITKIPPTFKIITGQYKNKAGELKKSFGVGILTENGKGADIHFLKKLGNLKTMNFGEKGISFFKSKEESKKIAIFESKMDYASAYQQIDFTTDTNIIIANSTSNYNKVVEKLQEENLKDIQFFNQNDKAGLEFVKNIVEKAKLKSFSYIQYKGAENGQDINDLHLNNIFIKERVKEVTQQEFNYYTKTQGFKMTQQITLTLFQQAIKAVKEQKKKAELLFGKERIETAKECINFFKANKENIEDVKDEEIKSESIFTKVKEYIEDGYKLTKAWLKELEEEQERQQQRENERDEGYEL